jgi:hypothetical protein
MPNELKVIVVSPCPPITIAEISLAGLSNFIEDGF